MMGNENELFQGYNVPNQEDLFYSPESNTETINYLPVATLQDDGSLLFSDGSVVTDWSPVQKISNIEANLDKSSTDPVRSGDDNGIDSQEIYDYTEILEEISGNLSSMRTLEAKILENQKTVSDNTILYQKISIGASMMLFGGFMAYCFIGKIK